MKAQGNVCVGQVVWVRLGLDVEVQSVVCGSAEAKLIEKVDHCLVWADAFDDGEAVALDVLQKAMMSI